MGFVQGGPGPALQDDPRAQGAPAHVPARARADPRAPAPVRAVGADIRRVTVLAVLHRRRTEVRGGGEKVGENARAPGARRGVQGRDNHQLTIARARRRRGAVPRAALLVQDGQPGLLKHEGTRVVRQVVGHRRRARLRAHRTQRRERRGPSPMRGGRDGHANEGPRRGRPRRAATRAVRRRV